MLILICRKLGGVTIGSSSVIVAILDSGIPLQNGSLSHTDLDKSSKMILGPDCIYGNSSYETDPTVKDELGHGTHVAGIAAAETNNSTGIAGVAWNCKILVIQVFDKYGFTTVDALANGIEYATDYSVANNKPVVMNYSGWIYASQTVEDAIAYAEWVCPIVIAAGNQNGSITFPANLAGQYYNVIAVGATQYDDQRAWYSNKGHQLTLVAPGGANDNHDNPSEPGDIYSTMPNYEVYFNKSPYFISQNYGYMAGTSMAAPHVTGTAALVLSLNSTLSPDEVAYLLMDTAEQVPGMGGQLWTSEYGCGRLNVNRTVLYTKYNVENIVTGTVSGTISQNTLLYGDVTVTNDLTVNSGINLVIEDEAVVSVNAGKIITVHGSIIAKGVTFQGYNGANWYGIDVDGSTTSYIKNSTIKDCDYGVIVGGTCSINLSTNDIQADEVGVKITEDANPTVYNSYVRAEGEADILSSGNGDGVIDNCSLCGTADAGHKNIGSAATLLNYYSEARNIIEGRDFAVSVYVTGGYPGYDYGKNYIKDSYSGHFNNSSGHSLNARNNYWGSGTVRISGPVVWQPALPSAPSATGPDWTLPKVSVDGMQQAWAIYHEGDYVKARQLAADILDANKSNECASEALFLMMKCSHRLGQLDDEQNNLAVLERDNVIHPLVKNEAVRWQMKHKVMHNRTQEAYSLAMSIPGTGWFGREILLDLALELLDRRGDLLQATRVLDAMVRKYPDKETDKLREDILAFYARYLGIYQEKDSPAVSEEDKSNSLQGYPNPFNLNCVIVYRLEKADWITITIFDILGREVKTLLNDRMEAGRRQIMWGGQDEQGLTVPNGVYLCRLISSSKRETMKLLLVK